MNKIERIVSAQVDSAAQAGLFAFWSAVARQYPAAMSGDLDPLADLAFRASALHAVRCWVQANVGLDLFEEAGQGDLEGVDDMIDEMFGLA